MGEGRTQENGEEGRSHGPGRKDDEPGFLFF
jgi:hypothetical protein